MFSGTEVELAIVASFRAGTTNQGAHISTDGSVNLLEGQNEMKANVSVSLLPLCSHD
jgi:hypothetical protein